MNDPDEDYFDDEGDDLDPLEEADLACGEMPTGDCALAGTEHCDFECPFRDDMLRRLDRINRDAA